MSNNIPNKYKFGSPFLFLSFGYSFALRIVNGIEVASDFLKRHKYIDHLTHIFIVTLLLWGIFYVDDDFIVRNQGLSQISNSISKALPWLETLKNNWGLVAQKQAFLQGLFILVGLVIYFPYSLLHWDIRLNERFYRAPCSKDLTIGPIVSVVLILLDIYANIDMPSIYSSFRQRYMFFMFNNYMSPASAFLLALGIFSNAYLAFYYLNYLFVYCGRRVGLRKHF